MSNISRETIKIDVGDWCHEADTMEEDLSNRDDIYRLLTETDMGPSQVARLAIVSRQDGRLDDGVLPENKLLLQTGGARRIAEMVASVTVKKRVGDREISVRKFVGPPYAKARSQLVEEGDESTYESSYESISTTGEKTVTVDDPIAVERATQYLLRIVPRTIHERLAILAVNGEDMKKVVRKLKREIDDSVKELGG